MKNKVQVREGSVNLTYRTEYWYVHYFFIPVISCSVPQSVYMCLHTKCTTKPKWCQLFLWIMKMVSSIATYKCSDVSMMQHIVNGCKNGNSASDKFTMTMVLPNQSSLCVIFG